MKTKLAFFDVDGTLSVPIYQDASGQKVIGFTDQEWEDYCVRYGEDSYQYCKPVAAVKAYAEKLKAAGACLFVLTTSQSVYETKGKERFVSRCYPGLFEQVIAVSSDKEKRTAILKLAEDHSVLPGDCELVDDTYAILLNVMQAGILPTHITHILEDER